MKNKNPIKANQVSKLLSIPLSTVYYLTQKGAIKSIRLGKHIRYRKEDIEYYLENGLGNLRKNEVVAAVEKRQCPRIKCSINCSYKINLPQVENNIFTGIIENLSASGLFFNGNNYSRIQRDTPMNLLFKINYPYEDKSEDVEIFGRVVRIDNKGIGIKYRTIPEEIKSKIVKYVG